MFGITWVLSLQDTLFSIDLGAFFQAHVTGQSLIIFGGGLFLLYKSVSEIHHKMEGEEEEGIGHEGGRKMKNLGGKKIKAKI